MTPEDAADLLYEVIASDDIHRLVKKPTPVEEAALAALSSQVDGGPDIPSEEIREWLGLGEWPSWAEFVAAIRRTS